MNPMARITRKVLATFVGCFVVPIAVTSLDRMAVAGEIRYVIQVGGIGSGEVNHVDFSENAGTQASASWVAAGAPVPSYVLYREGHPAPRVRSDKRSGWGQALLNREPCPYCGRSVVMHAASYFLLALGFVGQGLFGLRFILQWLASEKSKSVVIPEAFWWMSIAGAITTGVYAVSIMALPIIVSQGLNCLIYGRNLYFSRIGKGPVPNHI